MSYRFIISDLSSHRVHVVRITTIYMLHKFSSCDVGLLLSTERGEKKLMYMGGGKHLLLIGSRNENGAGIYVGLKVILSKGSYNEIVFHFD